MKIPALFKTEFDSASALKQSFVAREGERRSVTIEWKEATPVEVLFQADSNAVLECVFIQNLPENAEAMARVKVVAGRDSMIRCTIIHQGGSKAQIEFESSCMAEGANIQTQALTHSKNSQKHSILAKSFHPVPHTQSDLKVWSVANDQSQTLFNGVITIEKGAHHTEALQKNKNLILSEKATVDSIPQLFIFNDEVKCAHGSSTSTLDPEQYIYLQSRGIPHAEAERMITQGFMENAIHWIEDAATLSRVKSILNLTEEEL